MNMNEFLCIALGMCVSFILFGIYASGYNAGKKKKHFEPLDHLLSDEDKK